MFYKKMNPIKKVEILPVVEEKPVKEKKVKKVVEKSIIKNDSKIDFEIEPRKKREVKPKEEKKKEVEIQKKKEVKSKEDKPKGKMPEHLRIALEARRERLSKEKASGKVPEKKEKKEKKVEKKSKKEIIESDSDTESSVEVIIKKSAPKKSAPKKGDLPAEYFSDSDSI